MINFAITLSAIILGIFQKTGGHQKMLYRHTSSTQKIKLSKLSTELIQKPSNTESSPEGKNSDIKNTKKKKHCVESMDP